MEARFYRAALLAAALGSLGANYRTSNFVVTAPTPEAAQQIGDAAEKFRRELALEWLGKEMRPWSQPCPITAHVGDGLGAGGATSFLFERGEVFGWRMNIQGSLVRILDSVLPHEVTHTIFATHFRQPLPRWADEGACTTVEHYSERAKQQNMLIDFLRTGRGIPFSRMYAMKEYPHDVMPLYSQGHSLACFLIAQKGKRAFLTYLADGMRDENWIRATREHYGIENLAVLQNTWLDWVKRGSPAIKSPGATPALAASDRRSRPDANLIYRGQSDDTAVKPVSARTEPAEETSVYAKMRQAEKQPAPKVEARWQPTESPAPPSAAEPAPRDKMSVQIETPAPSEYAATQSAAPQKSRRVLLEWKQPVAGVRSQESVVRNQTAIP